MPQGSYPLVATISKGATVFVGSFFPSIPSIWQQVPLMDSLKYIFQNGSECVDLGHLYMPIQDGIEVSRRGIPQRSI